MEQKTVSNVCSKRHIPEELWPHILSRLPVKSLLRFRCVSKSWLSLIHDPDFCHLHLKNFKNNRDDTHLLVVECMPKRWVVRCSDTFEPNTEVLVTLPCSCHEGSWQIEFSINGLVLLNSGRTDLLGFEELVVWNPSIRKFHDIPSLPEIETEIETSPDSFFDVNVGLGYDLLAKDYKHVKLIFGDHDDTVHSVAIYTLGVASWKIIPFQGNGFSSWLWDPESLEYKTLYLTGNLYFLAKNRESSVWELVSIDLSSEVFSRISWPDPYQSSFDGPLSLTLVDGGGSLAVFDFKHGNMWVLEREPMCWIRRYSFDLRRPDFLYLKKSGDILMWWAEQTFFKLGTGKEFGQEWWTLMSSYNLETQKEKFLLQEKRSGLEIIDICGYRESLILLK